MVEFIDAALPWVAIGILLAILVVHVVSQKNKNVDESDNQDENDSKGWKNKKDRTIEGFCIGTCLGILFGMTGVFSLTLSVSLGVLGGIIIGRRIKK